jgi:hypothetical protein
MSEVYWAEVEQEPIPVSRVYWAEVGAMVQVSRAYWAEVESTADVGESISGSGRLPQIAVVTLVGSSTLFVGGTYDMLVTVEDQDGDRIPNVSPEVESSDPSVSTVALLAATDANGEATARVTAVAIGTATITAEIEGLTAQTQPTNMVGEDPPPIVVIEVTTVELSVQAVSIEVGNTTAATARVLDQNADPVAGVTVTWSSTSGAVIASPSSGTTGADGRVVVPLPALVAGTTTLTASCDGVDSDGVLITVTAVAEAPGYSTVGSAKVIVNCVSVVKRMGRPQPRRFSDADQRKIDPADTAFSRVKDNVERQIIWPNREWLKRWG